MWRRLVWGALLSVLVISGFAAAGDGRGKIRVVIIDGQNNHDWRATTPVMRKALLDSGRFSVAVATHLRANDKNGLPPGWKSIPFSPDLGSYDVVLSNYNGDSWPETFNRDLEERLKEGKIALVIVHAANNSFGNWKEYNRMIGMGWRGNDFGDRLVVENDGKQTRVPKGQGPGAGHGAYHSFRVTVRDPNHPITRGMPPEWLHAADELYHGMRGPVENVHLLATAFDDKKFGGTDENEPMIWTVTYGKGRVFHTPMGHDRNSMLCVGFLTTLLRGTEWAATGDVTQPMPANFPTSTKISTIETK